jgi:type IV pilus assembly protein PilO
MSKLEVLTDRPWYLQAALFGVVALLFYLVFWYFVTSGTRAETAKVEEEVATLKRANAGAQIAAQRLNEFKANYDRAKADYEDLKALLPEHRELTMVLANVLDRAKGRLKLDRFTPKEDVQQDFYSGKPVEIAVSGTYNNVGQFFAQLASYQRIVSITDFRIARKAPDAGADARDDNQTIQAMFLLTAYYAPPEKLQAVPAPDAQKAGGKKDGAKPAAAEGGQKDKKEAE